MNYQKITKNDTANGDGIRVTLWVSGCSHRCYGCHNPQTWDPDSGKEYTYETCKEICEELEKPWVAGLTLSGGDPFHENNRIILSVLVKCIKSWFPNKNIWCYTGYTLEQLWEMSNDDMSVWLLLENIDILVDGKYQHKLRDVSFPWAGSSNQRVWARVNEEWVQSVYDKEYREKKENKHENI